MTHTAPPPFRAVTVAFGEGRLERYDAYFEAVSRDHAPFSSNIDYTTFSDLDGVGAIRSAFRRQVDEIGLKYVVGEQGAAALLMAANTGRRVLCTLDVDTMEEVVDFFTAAANQYLARKDTTFSAVDLLVPWTTESPTTPPAPTPTYSYAEEMATEYAERVSKPVQVEDVDAQIERMLPEHRELVRSLVLPFARIRSAEDTDQPMVSTDSYVGGYPFIPADSNESWPTDEDQPMLFLMQANFADMPALAGYPTEGMLQWFCGAGEVYGQAYAPEPEVGTAGLHARWYSAADLTRPAAQPPTASTEDYAPAVSDTSPLIVSGPVRVVFNLEEGLPGPNDDMMDGLGVGPHPLAEAIEAAEEAADDEIWNVAADGDCENPPTFGGGDRIGGHPFLTQGDPRAGRPAEDCALLMQLDSDYGLFTMWGDGGSAQLFGNAAALATGDTSSLWWDWACH